MTEHTAENDAGPCPLCGSVAGYADGPPCLTCHYEPSAENDAVMKPNEDGSAAAPTRVHTAENDVPCRLAEGKVWHPAHNWNPMVPDPEDPQVLHIFTSPDVSLTCPGYRVISPGEGD